MERLAVNRQIYFRQSERIGGSRSKCCASERVAGRLWSDMLEITSQFGLPVNSVVQGYRAGQESKPQDAPAERPEDQVDLSPAAREYRPDGEVRPATDERVRELRQQIAADTYVTDDKLDRVVERLHAEIFGAAAPVS